MSNWFMANNAHTARLLLKFCNSFGDDCFALRRFPHAFHSRQTVESDKMLEFATITLLSPFGWNWIYELSPNKQKSATTQCDFNDNPKYIHCDKIQLELCSVGSCVEMSVIRFEWTFLVMHTNWNARMNVSAHWTFTIERWQCCSYERAMMRATKRQQIC